MRKRTIIESVTPKPCGHDVITFEGQTAPACLWGRGEPLAIPSGPEGEAMNAARKKHYTYDENAHRVPRPEVLDPYGEPWPTTRRPLLMQSR